MRNELALLSIVCLFWFPVTAVQGEDRVRGKDLVIERPTLISLGFEWRVQGDDNFDATAQVRYRKVGDSEWKDYLPLYRIGRGLTVIGITGIRAQIPEGVAGSIMDLEPDTEYEVRLELRDPDGVQGEAVRSVRLRTRAEPKVPAGAPVRHVYPPGYTGEKEKPWYYDVMHAVNGFDPRCDGYQVIHPNAAPPGTVVKVHAGVHKYDRHLYWKGGQNHTYWLHGTITLAATGTPEKPIYVVGAGDGEAVFDGDGCHNLFNLRGSDYIHFDDLTIRNTEIAFHGGFQGERGGGIKGLTVKNCWIENVVYGVLAQDGRSEDFTIADNVILGRNPHDRFQMWPRSVAGYAVNIAGQGHVACYNYAANFWDGINVATMGLPDPGTGQQSRAIDFYNNDIHNCADNWIETDGGYANLRMLRNRCFNCPGAGFSMQNVFAGPVYWIRNVGWNSKGAIKWHGAAPVYAWLHNTTSTPMDTVSNSMIHGGDGSWQILSNISVVPHRPGPDGQPVLVARYECGAGRGRAADYNCFRVGDRAATWRVGDETYPSLAEMQRATGLDLHSITVDDYSIFQKASEPSDDYRRIDPFVMPYEVDIRLRGDASPVDAGLVLPGINDDYAGKAPDLGAYEVGRPVPTYGPRGGQYLQRLEALRRGRYVPVTASSPKEKDP